VLLDEDDSASRRSALHAVAQFNFEARSSKELSFKAGDILTLFYRLSTDWWSGSINDRKGRIPDKYITQTNRYVIALP